MYLRFKIRYYRLSKLKRADYYSRRNHNSSIALVAKAINKYYCSIYKCICVTIQSKV